MTAGTKLVLTFSIDSTISSDWKVKIADGNWASLPLTAGLTDDAEGYIPLTADQTSLTVELTEDMVSTLQNNGGLVIQANGIILTKIALQ